MAQSQITRRLTQKRLNTLLKIINAVDKNSPCNATFLTLKRTAKASTSLSMNLPFLINVPGILPVVLIKTRSSRVAVVFLGWLLPRVLSEDRFGESGDKSAHMFVLGHHQGGLHAMYDGDGRRTSCALVKDFPAHGLTYILISVQFFGDV
jgi:hypothetical protein